ncbi:MAG: hypothetical protein K2H84_08410, partial [Paramuribaculum sp.]|nr:hypothetical protein [Paramuribaculum sp.]
NRLYNMLSGTVVLLFSAFLISGCSGYEPVEIYRLDSAAFSGELPDSAALEGLELWKTYCGRGEESTDSFWTEYCGSSAVKVFYPDVVERIGSRIPAIERELGKVKGELSKKFPEIEFPKAVYAVVSPYSQSVMLSDSIMLIALNHYLGADYPGYDGMVAEQKILKSPENVRIDVTEALLRSNYNFAGGDWASALSKMAYEGAVVLGVKNVTGCRLEEAVGTTGENLKLLEDNEKDIWKNLIEAQLIYNGSPRISDELIKPYPAKRYPSRTGRYIGYKIAEGAWRGGMSLTDLLSPDYYMGDDILKWFK